MPATAYSYVRFSSPAQAEGDSLRRQTEAARAWAERNGAVLDTSTTLHDLGRSAFTGAHRTNPDRHALAGFLRLVETGKVPPGSYLIVESLDRLSREHVRPALGLLLNLIEAGVKVVQLSPIEAVYDDKVEPMNLMLAIMELARGHSESKVKSQRVGAAWAQRRKAARENGETLTKRLPAWIEERGGQRVLIPERADVVRLIFDLAARGYGHAAIVKRLTEDRVPGFGPSSRWGRSYIALVLGDRRAMGEFQPRLTDGTPDGPPVAGYFPAVVSETAWHLARAGASQRRHRPGRTGSHVNLFAGLIVDALTGASYYRVTRTDGHRPGRSGSSHSALVTTDSAEGRGPARSFPLLSFERSVLSLMREIDPSEVLGDEPDESSAIAGELAHVEGRIAAIEAELVEGGEVPALARALRSLEASRRDLAARLAEARQQAANPLGESWGEAQSLLDALDSAPDQQDARLRLRSVLRRIVERIVLLVVPRGKDRIAAVQVHFHGGYRRDYLVLHRAARANASASVPASWTTFSVPGDRLPPFDLTNAEHASALASLLENVNLSSA